MSRKKPQTGKTVVNKNGRFPCTYCGAENHYPSNFEDVASYTVIGQEVDGP